MSAKQHINEIQMKQWRAHEARKHGVSESAIAMRLSRGGYPDLQTRRLNQRIVFVVATDPVQLAKAAQDIADEWRERA